MTIGERLIQLRGKRRQTEISVRSGVRQDILSRIENGDREPTLRQLVAIANVYHMSVIGLLSGVELGEEVYAAPDAVTGENAPLPFD